MAYDLLIKDGTLVDGSGLPGYRADIGIKDGRIVERGRLSGGARVIDAEGKIVAPGFIDIHTHYDTQIMWDPLLTCSPWHGVTTVVMGNCGFTLAPCRPKDRDYITRMFARVEGMNETALRNGLDWRWESFADYLRRIEENPLGINVGTMVGHSAVRRYVLGEQANARPADADEVQQMKRLVREAMAAGAFGFTTSFQRSHRDGDGAPVPSQLATHGEVLELGSTLAEFSLGTIEIITETATAGPEGFSEPDKKLLTALSLQIGRPINWNELAQNWDHPNAWRNKLDYMHQAAKEGAQVFAVARCQRMDFMFTLKNLDRSENSPIAGGPRWREVLGEPHEKQMSLLRDPQVRAAMKAESERRDPVNPPWAKLASIGFTHSNSGRHTQFEKITLGEISQKTGKHPVDILLDWSVEDELETEFAFIGRRNGDTQAAAEILRDPFCVAGISDAGAHADRLSGSNYSTHLLSYWVREMGVLSLEDAIRRLTFMPASIYGMRDRGLLREGMAADVVVFDYDKVGWLPTERFDDLPGGQWRLGNRAQGIDYLVVNGQVVFEGSRHTGALPGKLLRSTEYRL